MTSSSWVNPNHRPHRRKSTPKSKTQRSFRTRKSESSSAKSPSKQASPVSHQSSSTSQNSLLDQLTTLAQNVDLPKVQNTLNEVNKVMEEMNDLFRKFPRIQPPSAGPFRSKSHPEPIRQRPYPYYPVYPASRGVHPNHPYGQSREMPRNFL